MRILVIGNLGSMGRRYTACLKAMHEDVLGFDVGGPIPNPSEYDRAIIATPTETHFMWCDYLIQKGKDFLCEKPVSKDPAAVCQLAELAKASGVDGRMVSNWLYAVNQALLLGRGPTGGQSVTAIMGEMEIVYRSYNSGKDGFFWDCIQPIYMAGKFVYDNKSPMFEAHVDGNQITLEMIERSYLIMLSEWMYGDRNRLWSLEDAAAASKKVELIMGWPPPLDGGEIDFGEIDDCLWKVQE